MIMETGAEWSRKPCQEFKPCMKLRGNVFDYTELIRLRGKERVGRPQPVPLPSPLAVWIFREDRSDEMWQADLDMASGYIAVCARLAGC